MSKSGKRTLHQQLSMHHILLNTITAILCLSLLLWAHIDSRSFQRMLAHKSMLNDYFTNINQVRMSITAYRDTSNQEYFMNMRRHADLALQQSSDLREYYEAPAFVDQYYITEALSQALDGDYEEIAQGVHISIDTAFGTAEYISLLLQNNEYNIINAENEVFERSLAQINRDHSTRFVLVIFMAVLIIAMCFVLGTRLSSRMVAPLEFLTGQVTEASINLFEFMPVRQKESANEIAVLSEAFSNMIMKIQIQMQEINEKMKISEQLKQSELRNMRTDMLLLESELRAAQSLINPHFLYNCLSIISSLTYIEKAPKAREATQKVATFLRDSLKDVGRIVTIKNEEKRLQDYIAIQTLRFSDHICFHVHCDDEAREAGVPAMTLQPIVENAIVHGLREREVEGCVDIRITSEAHRVAIQITDNGIGMGQDIISSVNTLIAGEDLSAEGIGIGLRSVLLQLRMCFGGELKVSIESKPMEYTCIHIVFPNRKPSLIKPHERMKGTS